MKPKVIAPTKPTKGEYGTISSGLGKDKKEFAIVDYLRSTFADHRLISVYGVEGDSLVLRVENYQSSGRNPDQQLWLSRESVVGLLGTAMLYFSARGDDLGQLLQQSLKHDQIQYERSDNMDPSWMEDDESEQPKK
jgi:hypothetical protein